jgi:hypothetical protein
VRVVATALAIALAACHAGGEYAGSNMIAEGSLDKGETNGRMFDFVTDKPDGDDWQIRIRGTSIWAAYSKDATSDKHGGAKNLTEKESTKLWNMVDALDIPSRKKGKVDDDNGTVTLRLREPSDDGPHDVYTIYVSRDTEDADVLALGEYLQKLVSKHFNEQPNF